MAFITNGEKTKLGERLAQLTAHAERFDMLVGFFYFSGIRVVSDALAANEKVVWRVLVGMEAEDEASAPRRGASDGDVRDWFYAKMRATLARERLDTQAFHERLAVVERMLKEGRLELRKTRTPNHAKLYLFSLDESQVSNRRCFVTGSSNFSLPGLSLRDEFNVQIGDFGQDEAQAYFDALWADSVPLTETPEQREAVLKILREESVAADVSPYEAYLLVLRNYLDHQAANLREAQLDAALKTAGFLKYRYQADAVAQVMTRLEAYGGAILADVVGLGKSVIGGLVGSLSGMRGLVVCPPGLMGDASGAAGGWNEYLTKFGLKARGWEAWSRGKLDALAEKLQADPGFGLVVVDEAHYFRNERTADYAALAEICYGRKVLLLTATPFNNRPGDLKALLRLFSPGRESPLVVGGELDEVFDEFSRRYKAILAIQKAAAQENAEEVSKNLKKAGIERLACGSPMDFRKVRALAAKKAKALTQAIRQVMEKVVVRRNRLDLTSDPDYAGEVTTLAKVVDPREQFFSLTPAQDAFYDRVINEYFAEDGRFRGAIYHPQDYLVDQSGIDDAQTNLYKMMQRQLVMRFESSFGSFVQSVRNHKARMERARAYVDRFGEFVFSRDAMDRVLDIEDDIEASKAMTEFVAQAEERLSASLAKQKNVIRFEMSDPKFRAKEFLEDLDGDIALMDEILEVVEKLRLATNDPKAKALAETLAAVVGGTHRDVAPEPGSPKRKVLVFTMFADTVEHVGKTLAKTLGRRVLCVSGRNFGPEMAARVRANFDASVTKGAADDYDVLLATDKLSEGFNLNRAGLVVNYDIPWNPTRVIQRVGRVNRIGKKVFENLYIFNFFPTKRGSSVVANRAAAEAKMFAIHRILGEDAKMFAETEEPTAAALYDKFAKLDGEEEMSAYTKAKLAYAKALKSLEKNHPGTLERLAKFPPRVKTAWTDAAHGTFMFRRRGPGFFALARREGKKVEELSLEAALAEVRCAWETPRAPFGPEFWAFREKAADGEPKGVYELLETYRPKTDAPNNGQLSARTMAILGLERCAATLPDDLKAFAKTVADDIQNYGTIPAFTMRRLAEATTSGNMKDLAETLRNLLASRGADYLAGLRRAADAETVVVTIDKT